MKYYSAIISLFSLSFFAVISLLYLANISKVIENENLILKKKIKLTKEQININEIEYSLYNSYDYLQKMQKIYFTQTNNDNINKRISFLEFKNKNLENLYTVGIK